MKGKRDFSRLETHLRFLLIDLCTDWGFCIPRSDSDRIANTQQITAEEFAAAVLTAEGMTPEYEKTWRRRIERRFIERFGASASAADFVPPLHSRDFR